MKRIDSFKIKKSDGTYWLEVRDENDIVYCNSQNLKTREEAEELRVKAHEKLPFCKLNYT